MVSKTGETDDTVPLDNPHIEFMSEIFHGLSWRNPTESLANCTYSEFYCIFTITSKKLALCIRPSLARHSGASIDRALNLIDQLEGSEAPSPLICTRAAWYVHFSTLQTLRAGRKGSNSAGSKIFKINGGWLGRRTTLCETKC